MTYEHEFLPFWDLSWSGVNQVVKSNTTVSLLTTGYWQLLFKDLPWPARGVRPAKRHNNTPLLLLHPYCAEEIFRKCAGHIGM